jgi:protein ImuB
MPRSLHSIDLILPETVEAPRARSHPEQSRSRLWLAVCLPNLALECLPGAITQTPAVVIESQRGQLHVVAANAKAQGVGIGPGSKLCTALALTAALQTFERSPHAERRTLESLAEWAGMLTSLVSIEPPEGLLLEVSGSLRLFGSLEAIKSRLGEELVRRRLEFRLCLAPTPTAALWLARAASDDVLLPQELAGRLGRLPLAITRWPKAVQELLRDLGVRTVGECVRLPRDGFARRIGEAYLQELDRALGRRADLRTEFKRPEKWKAKIELFEESTDNSIFIEAIEQMLDELVAELRSRHVQVRMLKIGFDHLHRAPTFESFDLREPTHDRELLLHLIRDRLERAHLPTPALAISVESGFLLPLAVEAADLFEKTPVATLARDLLERLKERFGATAVYGVQAVAEHRPERAWAKLSETVEGSFRRGEWPLAQDRPLWLLRRPVPLGSDQARNHYRGSIELRSGPECIESGWWDEHDIGRDYYVAVSAHGQKLWIFRDRRSRIWHLHGLFG